MKIIENGLSIIEMARQASLCDVSGIAWHARRHQRRGVHAQHQRAPRQTSAQRRRLRALISRGSFWRAHAARMRGGIARGASAYKSRVISENSARSA
jgi:hypothetical protein